MSTLFSSNVRLFGLRIWPRRLTDAEYVERLRKQLRANRWLRYLHAAVGLGVVIIAVRIIEAFLDAINNPAGPLAQQNAVNIVFGTAIVGGVFVGLMLGSMMHNVLMSIFGVRQEKLLVDCWDALNELLAERSQVDRE